jgi:GMP synthase-like glutamine amidotransferase
MSSTVLIIQHVAHEAPGVLQTVLDEHQIPTEIVHHADAVQLPSPGDYGAVVVLGGPMSANDDTPMMKEELRFLEDVLQSRVPYLGVCLGLQTMVKAAGGEVVKNDVREVGFRDEQGTFYSVDLTEHGLQDPLMKKMPETFAMFHLHGETVERTKDMTLLASGEWCVNQIVRIAPTQYGIQGHLELTNEMFADWCTKDAWLKECDQKKLQEDWRTRRSELQLAMRLLFGNFLGVAGLV